MTDKLEGTIRGRNAPEIRLDDLEDFNKLKNNLQPTERSPVVHTKSHTEEVFAFVYQGVVYTHKRTAK